MMAWHSEPDEQVQQDWHSRSAKKREELSLSIEETLADNALIEDPFSDEMDESFQGSNSSMIILPRLSLQSKPMPVVRVEPKEVTNVTFCATTDSVEVPQSAQKKRRLAGRTTKVHLQAVPKSEKKSGGKISIETEKNVFSSDGDEQISRKNNSKRNSSSERGAVAKGKMGVVVQESLAGNDVLKQGQREVAVNKSHIFPSNFFFFPLFYNTIPCVSNNT